MRKILAYELKSVLFKKIKTVTIVACFLTAYFILFYFSQSFTNGSIIDGLNQAERSAQAQRCQEILDYYHNHYPMFENEGFNLSDWDGYSIDGDKADGGKDYVYSDYLKNKFFVETQTIIADYLDIGGIYTNAQKTFIGDIRTVNMGLYGFVFMIVAALCVYSLYFSDDADSGRMKNLLASGLSRRKIFVGKLIFSMFLLFLVALGIYVLGLVGCSGVKGIFDYNNKFSVVSIAGVFTVKMLLNYLVAVFVFSLACLFSQSAKKGNRAVIYALITLACELLVSVLLSLGSFSGDYSDFKYFPLLNVFMYEVVLSAASLIPTLVFLIVSSAAMLCFATVKFEKKDMV